MAAIEGEFYHYGIKRDEKRSTKHVAAIPIHAYTLGGVTFHYLTATYDRTSNTYAHKAGQFRKLNQKQRDGIVAALKVDRTPCLIVDRAEGEGPSFKKLSERESTYGKGKVVQWEEVLDDQDDPEPIGWHTKVVDLSDKDYEPMQDPRNEVPLSDYVFMNQQADPSFNPPALTMPNAEDEADKIEREEQARDPVAFEKQQRKQAHAKQQGIPAVKS